MTGSPVDDGKRRRSRERVDRLLVERGLAPSREQAQALLLAGRVSSGGKRLDKPGQTLALDAPLEVAPGPRWVGRGGHKLAGALAQFDIVVRGRDALDVGASTGGFTHVLLDGGASRVIALDVGHGQLDWSLRSDPRVVVLDGVNARYLAPEDLPFRPSLATVDVSFISLALVLPAVGRCVAADGEIVALVKPQFEAGRASVGRGGIVRDPEVWRRVLDDCAGQASALGYGVAGCARSALAGAEGNREFFLHLRLDGAGLSADEIGSEILASTASDELPR